MEPTEYQTEETTGVDRGRRLRRWWWPVALIAVILLLVLTPPLLNVSRFQKRIVTSMSQSLGRPVHLDRASLHLLPMPGFTIENLVVSEDPAFGNEPIIRANTVEATLRAGSLWKRRLEFSTVRFVEPSVNLVRRADGRWNLEGVLVNASHVESAPTVQQKAGPEPRFPYIEATGGRINIKQGAEKMPFALTDADFALWLPSANVWRVRLEGKPARTDANISDPGVVRVEGSLQRAAHMADVPVDLHASWYDAPLGEASRLLSGEDLGWRGTLHTDATLTGPLGEAKLKTQVTLDDLRRADLVPVQTLDVSVSCRSDANVPAAVLQEFSCTVPVRDSHPLLVDSPSIDLARPGEAETRMQAQQLPLEWVFGWMRLFSARIPARPAVAGTIDAAVTHAKGDPAAQWSGTVDVTVPVGAHGANGRLVAVKGEAAPAAQSFPGVVTTTKTSGWNLTLAPTSLRLGPGAELTLSGQASAAGYGFTLTGQASSAQLAEIARALPQLADASGLLLPKSAAAADAIRPVALTCSRSWAGGQSCAAAPPPRRPKVVRASARRR